MNPLSTTFCMGAPKRAKPHAPHRPPPRRCRRPATNHARQSHTYEAALADATDLSFRFVPMTRNYIDCLLLALGTLCAVFFGCGSLLACIDSPSAPHVPFPEELRTEHVLFPNVRAPLGPRLWPGARRNLGRDERRGGASLSSVIFTHMRIKCIVYK